MVGVPGRSKGCKTCRERRKLCDRQKPICGQCVRLNLQCLGYDRNLIFIAASGAPKEDSKRTIETLRKAKEKSHHQYYINADAARPDAPSTALQLHPSLLTQSISLHAVNQQQLLSNYVQSSMPLHKLTSPENVPWITLMKTSEFQPPSLHASLLALCISRLARQDNNQSLVRESLKFYVRGLRELQKTLSDRTLLYKDETLAACTALAAYEFLECPSGTHRAYSQHHVGCGKLIELRGPEAHMTGLGHQLFLIYRSAEGLLALDRRETSFGDTPWIQVPWRYNIKSPFQQLMDVFLIAPAIIKKSLQLESLKSYDFIGKALEVLDDLWFLESKLQEFYDRLEHDADGPLYWEVPSRVIGALDNEGNPEAGYIYSFATLEIGLTLSLYWAAVAQFRSGTISLYIGLSMIDVPAQPPSQLPRSIPTMVVPANGSTGTVVKFDIRTLPPLGERVNIAAMARNVLRSVEYCCDAETKMHGKMGTIAPLHMIIDILQRHPTLEEELVEARSALQKIYEAGVPILKSYGRI